MSNDNIFSGKVRLRLMELGDHTGFLDAFELNLDALRRRYTGHDSYVDQAAEWYNTLSWWQRRAMAYGLFSTVTTVGLALHVGILVCLMVLIVGALFFFLLEQHSTSLQEQETRIIAEFGFLKSSVQHAVMQLYSVETQLHQLLEVTTLLETEQRGQLDTLSKQVSGMGAMTDSLLEIVDRVHDSGDALVQNTQTLNTSFIEVTQMLEAFSRTEIPLLSATNTYSADVDRPVDSVDRTAFFIEAEATLARVDALLSFRTMEVAGLSQVSARP